MAEINYSDGSNFVLKVFIACIVCVLLVVVCYFYVDQAVAYWIYDHHVSKYFVLKWFTYLSTAFSCFVILLYLYVVARYTLKKLTYFDRVALAFANSITVATFVKNALKIVFGRSWPLTWIKNNQSLIQNHVYGFRFFHGTTPYSAFPSGHTAVIVAAMTVLWMTYPRARLLYLIMAMLVIFGLIGMNYHFVSDVIGGAFIGVMTGYYTVKLSNLNPDKKLSEELL